MSNDAHAGADRVVIMRYVAHSTYLRGMMILMENSIFFVLNDHSLFLCTYIFMKCILLSILPKYINFEVINYAPSGNISPHNV